MERAGRLIGKLAVPKGTVSVEDLACAAWPAAVGRKVAARTRAARMVRSTLIVEVEDSLWQRQLFVLTRQILSNLARSLGPGLVEDLEFRVVPPRREPQRARQSMAEGAGDEADGIADPVLRSIYKAARKKSLA
jgi:predicted nucleic acid-binding Zn ribbon protein